MSQITLLNTDCMDYMKTQPDNAFELSIVDPPYGIREDGHRENNRSKLAVSKNYHKALWVGDKPVIYSRDKMVVVRKVDELMRGEK